MRYLIGQGFTRFIELGPGRALSGFMRRIDKTAQMLNVEDLAQPGSDRQGPGQLKRCIMCKR